MNFPQAAPITDEQLIQLRRRNDLVDLLRTSGWKHIDEHIREDRQAALDALLAAKGTLSVIGEATLRWQIINSVYSSIESFIHDAIREGDDIALSMSTTLEDELLREQLNGRYSNTDTGTDPASY